MGNSWVAAQLAASQEGLSSLELVSWPVGQNVFCDDKEQYIFSSTLCSIYVVLIFLTRLFDRGEYLNTCKENNSSVYIA
jgi:hypothetical protein